MGSAVRPSHGRSRDGVDVATDRPTVGAARLRQDSAPLWITESDCFGGGEYRCASPWLPALSQVTNEAEARRWGEACALTEGRCLTACPNSRTAVRDPGTRLEVTLRVTFKIPAWGKLHLHLCLDCRILSCSPASHAVALIAPGMRVFAVIPSATQRRVASTANSTFRRPRVRSCARDGGCRVLGGKP